MATSFFNSLSKTVTPVLQSINDKEAKQADMIEGIYLKGWQNQDPDLPPEEDQKRRLYNLEMWANLPANKKNKQIQQMVAQAKTAIGKAQQIQSNVDQARAQQKPQQIGVPPTTPNPSLRTAPPSSQSPAATGTPQAKQDNPTGIQSAPPSVQSPAQQPPQPQGASQATPPSPAGQGVNTPMPSVLSNAGPSTAQKEQQQQAMTLDTFSKEEAIKHKNKMEEQDAQAKAKGDRALPTLRKVTVDGVEHAYREFQRPDGSTYQEDMGPVDPTRAPKEKTPEEQIDAYADVAAKQGISAVPAKDRGAVLVKMREKGKEPKAPRLLDPQDRLARSLLESGKVNTEDEAEKRAATMMVDKVAQSGGTLSPYAKEMYADMFMAMGPMALANTGFGKDLKTEIINSAASKAKDLGLSGADLTEREAGYKAGSSAKTANVKKYSMSTAEAQANLKLMQDAYDRITSGKSPAIGADDMLLASRHIAMTIGGVAGARVGQEMMRGHLDARSLPQELGVIVDKLYSGAQLSPEQRSEFISLAKNRLETEQKKLEDAKKQPAGINSAPPSASEPKKLDATKAKEYLTKAGGDKDKARALAKADNYTF